MLPDSDKELFNKLEMKEKDLELESEEIFQMKKRKQENSEANITQLRLKLNISYTELDLKKKLLIEAQEKCIFSEEKIKKMESFSESQQLKLVEMENKYKNLEKVFKKIVYFLENVDLIFFKEKQKLSDKVIKLESDDTMERVIEELKLQHQKDLNRVSQVKSWILKPTFYSILLGKGQ